MTEEIIIDGVNVARCYHFGVFGGGMCGLSECGGLCKDFNNCLYKQLKRLEQERDEWKKKYEDAANENLNEIYELIKKNDAWRGIVSVMNERLEKQINELKTELHNKVEFIQEQRTIINNYEKEIEMYEKCQGKRASKREKELENDLDNLLIKYAGCKTANTAIQEENKKLISALEEIRENLVKLKTNDEDDFTYEYSKIEDKINECLGE